MYRPIGLGFQSWKNVRLVPETAESSYETVEPAGQGKVVTTVEDPGVTVLTPKSVLTGPWEAQVVDWLAMAPNCLKSTAPSPEKLYEEVWSWDCSGKRNIKEQVPV
jgi:hypothetical protein